MKPKRLATNKQKAVLYILQEGLCNICKQELIDYEADHIKEWSTGGETKINNLQLLCKTCHKTKTSLFLARDKKN